MDKKDFYNNTKWRTLRKTMLAEQPLCQNCKVWGREVKANQVHHIIKFYEQYDDEMREQLLLDKENLVCLCDECHRSVHGDPYKIHPLMVNWFGQIKDYLCAKYFQQGTVIKYTADKNYRKL